MGGRQREGRRERGRGKSTQATKVARTTSERLLGNNAGRFRVPESKASRH